MVVNCPIQGMVLSLGSVGPLFHRSVAREIPGFASNHGRGDSTASDAHGPWSIARDSGGDESSDRNQY